MFYISVSSVQEIGAFVIKYFSRKGSWGWGMGVGVLSHVLLKLPVIKINFTWQGLTISFISAWSFIPHETEETERLYIYKLLAAPG